MYQHFPNCERDFTYHTVILPSTMSKKTLPNVMCCHDVALHDGE